MEKVVKEILGQYLDGKQLSEVEDKLRKSRCIIYQSSLPALNEQPILHVDGTPDKDYPVRILQAYRQHCNCQWASDMDGGEVTNPLLKAMNETNVKRAEILDYTIRKIIYDRESEARLSKG